MKTREELLLEFQKKFDKERKKEIWKLLYYFPTFIIINSVFLSFSIFFFFIATTGFGYFVGCICLLGAIFYTYVTIFEFFGIFNSIKNREIIQQQIHSKAKEKEKWFEKRISIEPVCDGGTLEIWMKLAVEYHCCSTENIKEIIVKEGESLEQELLELNTQWQVYDQSPEKNFWQYVKSKKWLKK